MIMKADTEEEEGGKHNSVYIMVCRSVTEMTGRVWKQWSKYKSTFELEWQALTIPKRQECLLCKNRTVNYRANVAQEIEPS
jgi:hypothetical protein